MQLSDQNLKSLKDIVARGFKELEIAAKTNIAKSDWIPIPFFGDVEKYLKSELRVVTVGLNPSDAEFEDFKKGGKGPFSHFFDLDDSLSKEDKVIQACKTYFENRPYKNWFQNYNVLLKGLGICNNKFYENAIHIDIATTVATNPTWSDLDEKHKRSLAKLGEENWDEIIQLTNPQLIVCSVRREFIDYKFKSKKLIDQITFNNNSRKTAELWNYDSRFLLTGGANFTPLMNFTDAQKKEIGEWVNSKINNQNNTQYNELDLSKLPAPLLEKFRKGS